MSTSSLTKPRYVGPTSGYANGVRLSEPVVCGEVSSVLSPEELDQYLPLGAPDAGRRYENLGQLGIGGQSEVHRCRDMMLNRVVAVKRLRRKWLGNQDAITRFAREARLIAHSNLPGMPVVYELDRDQIGRPLMVMNLIEGYDMRWILHQLRLGDEDTQRDYPLEDLIQILLSVADTLTHAEARGIVHCDLKPENIMVDSFNRTWLIDWGSAQVINQSDVDRDKPPEEFLGSLAYAAPEQIRGAVVSNRSDVYSLSTVLYDCLALDTMIQASNGREAIESALTGNHPAPSEVTSRDSIPSELEEVCLKGTQLNPSDRYSSMRAFTDDLKEAFLVMLANITA